MKRTLSTVVATSLLLVTPIFANASPSEVAPDDFHSQVDTLNAEVRKEQSSSEGVPTMILVDTESGKKLYIGYPNESVKEVISIDEFEEQLVLFGLLEDDSNDRDENDDLPESQMSDKPTTPIKEVVARVGDTKELGDKDTKPSVVTKEPVANSLLKTNTSMPSTMVSLDIEWEPGDKLDAIASPPPPPEPEPETEDVDNDVYEYEGQPVEVSHGPDVTPPAPSNSITQTALQYVGYPYSYGGTTPSGFDCSGFTSYIFAQHGKSLPRTSYAQGAAGVHIPHDQAQPGDLVILNGGGHVAIYLGNGQIVHASTPSTGVKTGSLYGSYYFVRF